MGYQCPIEEEDTCALRDVGSGATKRRYVR